MMHNTHSMHSRSPFTGIIVETFTPVSLTITNNDGMGSIIYKADCMKLWHPFPSRLTAGSNHYSIKCTWHRTLGKLDLSLFLSKAQSLIMQCLHARMIPLEFVHLSVVACGYIMQNTLHLRGHILLDHYYWLHTHTADHRDSPFMRPQYSLQRSSPALGSCSV